MSNKNKIINQLSKIIKNQKNIDASLIGGSHGVKYNDIYSDIEFGFFTKKIANKDIRLSFYNKINAKIINICNESDFENDLFGFSDKVQVDNVNIDFIWMKISDCRKIIMSETVDNSTLNVELEFYGNIQRGKWIKGRGLIIQNNSIFINKSKIYFTHISNQRKNIVEYKNLEKLFSRKQWAKFVIELYYIFDSFVLLELLKNKIFPIGSKWYLSEIEHISYSKYIYWNKTFKSLESFELDSLKEYSYFIDNPKDFTL